MNIPTAPADRLTEALKQGNLRMAGLGHPVIYLPSALSTNAMAHELARAGAAEGTMVITDCQLQGRGRLGRRWIASSGNDLTFSIITRPVLLPALAFQMTAIASLAVAHAIRGETGLDARIKWPNDIYVRERKTSGILTELGICGDQLKYIVAGIGINVNSDPSAFTELKASATSLMRESGRCIDRLQLLKSILAFINHYYGRFTREGFGELKIMWDELSLISGRRVTIATDETVCEGIVQSVADDGTLHLRQCNGSTSRFVYGDVSLSWRKE